MVIFYCNILAFIAVYFQNNGFILHSQEHYMQSKRHPKSDSTGFLSSCLLIQLLWQALHVISSSLCSRSSSSNVISCDLLYEREKYCSLIACILESSERVRFIRYCQSSCRNWETVNDARSGTFIRRLMNNYRVSSGKKMRKEFNSVKLWFITRRMYGGTWTEQIQGGWQWKHPSRVPCHFCPAVFSERTRPSATFCFGTEHKTQRDMRAVQCQPHYVSWIKPDKLWHTLLQHYEPADITKN